jgi:hypothetical protein
MKENSVWSSIAVLTNAVSLFITDRSIVPLLIMSTLALEALTPEKRQIVTGANVTNGNQGYSRIVASHLQLCDGPHSGSRLEKSGNPWGCDARLFEVEAPPFESLRRLVIKAECSRSEWTFLRWVRSR